MVQSNSRSGRLRKYRRGWESANARIYLSNEIPVEWRRLRSEQGLASDNTVAAFLLERNKLLTNVMEQQLQLETQTSVINRLAEMASMYCQACKNYIVRQYTRDA